MLDLGNGVRHRGLRNRQQVGGFPHDAGYGHRHEDVQIVQLQATADTIIPPHDRHFDERDAVMNRRLWGALQYRIAAPLYRYFITINTNSDDEGLSRILIDRSEAIDAGL